MSSYGITTLECYDSQAHNDGITLQSATGQDRTHYRRVMSSPDCIVPFRGIINSGARFERTSGVNAFVITEPNARFENLSVSYQGADTNGPCFSSSYDNGFAIFRNCIAYDNPNSGGKGFYILSGDSLIYHCISLRAGQDGISISGDQDATVIVACCTAIGHDRYGISLYSNPVSGIVGINNYAADNGTSDFYDNANSWEKHGGWNASKDTSADMGGGQTFYYNSQNLVDAEIDDKTGIAKSGQTLNWDSGSGQQAGRSLNDHLCKFTSWNGFFPSGEYPFDYHEDGMADQTESNSRTYIMPIDGKIMDIISGENWRVEYAGHSSGECAIIGASIGTGAPDYTDSKRILFSGENYTTIEAGGRMWSDWMSGETFEISGNTEIACRVFISGEHWFGGTAFVNGSGYIESETDYVMVNDIPAYTGYEQYFSFITRIQKSRIESGETDWNLDIRNAPRSVNSGEAWDVGASKSVSSWQYPPYDSTWDSCGILPSGEDADYSSFNTWESATDNDLSNYGKTTLWCYDNLGSGEHDLSGTNQWLFSGATNSTSGEYRQAVGSPFCKTPFTGKWQTGCNLFWSGETINQGINLTEDRSQARDFALKCIGSSDVSVLSAVDVEGNRAYAQNVVVAECENYGTQGGYGFASSPVANEGTGKYNCIALNCKTVGFYSYQFGKNFDYCYSCTAIGNPYNFYAGWIGFLVFNCLSKDAGTQGFKANGDTALRFSDDGGWNISSDDSADLYGQAGNNYKQNASGELDLAIQDSTGLMISGETLAWSGGAGDNAGRNVWNDATAIHNMDSRLVGGSNPSGEYWAPKDIRGEMRSMPWTPDSVWNVGASDGGGQEAGGGAVQPVVFIVM